MQTESPPIIVIARRETDSDGSQFWTFVRATSGTAGVREVEPRNLSENPAAPMDLEITLVIEKTDASTDEAKMIAAAKALTQAIARALDALRTRAESEVIAVNGVAVSVGALIASILNTDYIVSDRPDAFYANYGVGAAEYSATGRHTDRISYRAIGGDPANPSAGYYGHPNYEGRGLLALVLHEAFHLTPAGKDWYDLNVAAYRNRYGQNAPFSGANWLPYALNVERGINRLALNAMAAIGQPALPSQPPFFDMQPPVVASTIP